MRLLLPHKTHLTDWRLSAAGIIVLLACIARMRRLKDSTSWLFLLWFAIPVVAIGLRDVTTQDCLLRNLRYVALAVPGIAGMIALLIDGFGPRMRWVLAAVLVATLFWQSEFPSGRNPQARLVGRILRERAAPDDLVVYSSVDLPPHWLDHLFLPASYYYPNSPHPTVLLSELPTVGFANTLREHRRIFVVSALLPRSSKIFPHTHEVTWESNFIYQFGKVYELTRKNLGPEP